LFKCQIPFPDERVDRKLIMYAKSLWNTSVKAMNGHHQKDIPGNLSKVLSFKKNKDAVA